MEGPRVWYNQLSDDRQFKHDEWVQAFGHVQRFVIGDPSWDGPAYTITDLPVSYNRRGSNLPRMSVMVKYVPELPEFEFNNLLRTWGGMVPPGIR